MKLITNNYIMKKIDIDNNQITDKEALKYKDFGKVMKKVSLYYWNQARILIPLKMKNRIKQSSGFC